MPFQNAYMLLWAVKNENKYGRNHKKKKAKYQSKIRKKETELEQIKITSSVFSQSHEFHHVLKASKRAFLIPMPLQVSSGCGTLPAPSQGNSRGIVTGVKPSISLLAVKYTEIPQPLHTLSQTCTRIFS